MHTTWDTEGLLNDTEDLWVLTRSTEGNLFLHAGLHIKPGLSFIICHWDTQWKLLSYSCMHKAQTLITKTGSCMVKILSGSCFLEAGKQGRTYLRIVPLPTIKQMCLQGLDWGNHVLQSEEGVVFKCAKQFWFWMLLFSGVDFPPFCHWREVFQRSKSLSVSTLRREFSNFPQITDKYCCLWLTAMHLLIIRMQIGEILRN